MVYRTSNFLILIDTEKKNEKGKRKRKTETPKGQREKGQTTSGVDDLHQFLKKNEGGRRDNVMFRETRDT